MSKRINSTGTPIYVTNRHGRGVTIHQGFSKVLLSRSEVQEVVSALADYLPADGAPRT
ncbi:hypothetical protein H7K45_20810 [Mycobacterium yunnanensis]|uniref:Uncharacterized protein n=1 Tax=Mycobacterium yunnanensis TaxID=368477 RepID=A0A9X2YPB6_9MYCO|nr:hypothetical protein [Mycobacterium yunnanensis]MCV7422998.1 hypothetical protein [Mycobacterium yunnanensis]